MPPYGWIALLAGAGLAVGALAFAGTGGSTTPAKPATPTPATPATPASAGTTTPSGDTGTTPVTDSSMITAAQMALVSLGSFGYLGPADGNSTTPSFVSGLASFQRWVNGNGGYTPPGGTARQLNTNGLLDFATFAALMSAAAANTTKAAGA